MNAILAENLSSRRGKEGRSGALIALIPIALIGLAMGLAGGVASAQSCTPENPCVLSMSGAFGYPDSVQGCSADYLDYYRKRFLQGHFDNGTPNDATDDSIVIGFSAFANIFGNMQNMTDVMSLPSVANLEAALSAAQATGAPFVVQLSSWGCQFECFGRRSATVEHLMGHDESWMQSPAGDLGFTFSWCNPLYTFTYGLHPDAGLPGPDGLQALFERNLRHIAGWIADNVTSVPANRDYLTGVVIASETHFGDERWGFDYSPSMLAGFQDFVEDVFGCAKLGAKGGSCLDAINFAYGTSFASLADVLPPIAACTSPLTAAYCQAWDTYRNEVLSDHLGRVADLFVDEGVPADMLFGHDLKAAGGFVAGPVVLTNRHPGLTAYSPSFSVFEAYADCTSSAGPCREWAIAEGFLSVNSQGDQDPQNFADDLDHIFDLDARFIHVMRRGLHPVDGVRPNLLGSGLEKGIHLWGMQYSNDYLSPLADLDFNPATSVLSGCVYDPDSVWMGPFTQNGGWGTDLDLNDVELRITVTGQAPIIDVAEVATGAPWCGAGGVNFSRTLGGLTGSESIVVSAVDYPTDDQKQVFCWQCDDDDPPRMYVDAPAHNQTVSGDFLVSGWATDASGVASVTFEVDGNSVALSGYVYGTQRAGVCVAHDDLNDPNCPNVGWQGTLDTTAFSNGRHTLRVTATDAVGNPKLFNRSFITDNQLETDPPRMYVDAPAHNQTVSGDFLVSGWATDASGVASVTFEVDGDPVVLSGYVYGTQRASVCVAHGDLNDPNCPNVGWQGTLDTTAFSNGSHILRVTATDALGNPPKLFNRSFITDNQLETDPPRMYVDAPAHNQTVSGNFLVSGWATDASGVASVTFEVDGNSVVLSGYVYGTQRAGVCVAHGDLNDPNCPNVGWRGTLDTTAFGNGGHTLRVTATDALGNPPKLFNRSFTIQN